MSATTLSFLAPLSLEAFFAEFWEQQPVHIARKEPCHKALVDFSAIESLLSSQPLYYPGVQLTQSGLNIEASSYADAQNRILPLRLLELYKNGATIVLSRAHDLFPPLHELCREVMRTCKMRCQTNVYVSPPGKQGFNAHYDTHDVFILQVSGAKTFNFYPSSVVLPFPDERFDASTLLAEKIDESIALSAGDTLYIPRGVVHDAVADGMQSSIHITLGVYPVLMRDVLQEAVQKIAQSNPAFRKSLDSYRIASLEETSQDLSDMAASMMQEVADALREPELFQQISAGFYDELSLSALQKCDGVSLGSLSETPNATESRGSTIRLRQDMLIDFDSTAEGVKIRSFGQIIEFASPISDAVLTLLTQTELCIDDLDYLSDDQREAMIDRLLQENLAEINT